MEGIDSKNAEISHRFVCAGFVYVYCLLFTVYIYTKLEELVYTNSDHSLQSDVKNWLSDEFVSLTVLKDH